MLSHTVYFAGMMVFTLTSQMYHRISVLVPVLVRVPEYLSTSTSTSTSTITFELTSTVRVPEIQYSSTASTSTEYEYPSPAVCCAVGFEVGWGVGVQGWSGGGSGQVVLIDDGRVYQSKAADALVQVKTTKFGTNVGLNMLLNISSRYLGGLFWSRQLRDLPSSDGYFFLGVRFW